MRVHSALNRAMISFGTPAGQKSPVSAVYQNGELPLILAFLAKSWLTSTTATPMDATSYVRRFASIVGGFLGTVVGTVYLYVGVWQQFAPLFLLTPMPLLPLVGTAGGLLAGLFLAVIVQSASRGHRIG
jgi:hypothetical protein